ncbi:hypothetical protein CXB65_24615 [Pseudomonas monteilii]|uniref:Uncharacterized protein n=1 Tax=Pseudomonas monteilii TaxID=76759 RepID=A0A2N1ILG2_9PSED|nr:hypothetical protein CXB65_24615 [Pseudomonas monteilii]
MGFSGGHFAALRGLARSHRCSDASSGGGNPVGAGKPAKGCAAAPKAANQIQECRAGRVPLRW